MLCSTNILLMTYIYEKILIIITKSHSKLRINSFFFFLFWLWLQLGLAIKDDYFACIYFVHTPGSITPCLLHHVSLTEDCGLETSTQGWLRQPFVQIFDTDLYPSRSHATKPETFCISLSAVLSEKSKLGNEFTFIGKFFTCFACFFPPNLSYLRTLPQPPFPRPIYWLVFIES